MSNMVLVGCRLPHGLVLESPVNPDFKVTLKGLNRSKIIGATYVTTEVNAEFWELWSASNANFPALKNGAIFVAKNERELNAVNNALSAFKTGFEPMGTDGKDRRATGAEKVED